MRAEQLVEAVQHFAGAQLLYLAHRGGKGPPEFAEQILPLDLAVGDLVEPFFQVGGEVVFDITGEERLRNEVTVRPRSSGYEALAIEPHIFAARSTARIEA